MDSKKEIYFHVGLAKTATTFLQYQVFPKFKNVHYLQRTNYKHFRRSIENTEADKIFISNEFDRQLEREADNFSSYYPQAKPIMVLRRHDKWIASQYRRRVKNGTTASFTEFIDLDQDQGEWKQKDSYFYPKIKYLEDKFDRKPLVLLFDELKENPYGFFDKIAGVMDASYDRAEIDTSPRHQSYNEKQLKVVKKASEKFLIRGINYSDIYWVSKIQRLIKMIPRYLVLYSAFLIPDSFVSDQPLIPEEELERVREFYEEDWEKCKQYAQFTGKDEE
jgi:hypothetical protein